ncbi:MAG TPA: DEAD/DEAH box helicase, partial [Algoriphagus sp.]|nr:DEAD/DEAH box helicase [Algoriphagus sp.]
MDRQSFLTIYQSDPIFQTLAHQLGSGEKFRLQVRGLAGSLDMVLLASYFEKNGGFHLIIAQDKEEAAYLNSDLQNLLNTEEHMIFPGSFKRPYQYDEVDNANVLMRAEILNQILETKGKSRIVITYPEALYEKVINKRSLVENTFSARVGESVDMEFVTEILTSYDFERTDFVYEPGQFAIRGGILDVFSFSNEHPYRLELFGKEIESIRTFDPESQLSIANVELISLIPNVQTKLLQEVRQSFLGFLPEKSIIWLKDYQLTSDVMDESFHKAEQAFSQIVSQTHTENLLLKPSDLFDSGKDFSVAIKDFSTVEFGRQFYLKTDNKISWESQPQASFNKNFDLLVANLSDNEKQGFTNVITAENEKQIDRLLGIFHELDPTLQVQSMLLGLREGFVDKQGKMVCYTDHQLFERFHRYKTRAKASKSKALTIKELKALHPGDYIVHVDYGVGRFAGLEKVDVGGKMQEAVRLIFRDDDLLYVNIHSLHKISKYSGQEGQVPSMSKLGSPEWENKKSRVKKQVKDIAKDLINLYAKRRSAHGFSFSRDSVLQVELESSFIYEDTPDQALATTDVKSDMEKSYPMDRLVCGDVGFGKTEVAIRAAFKAVNDRKQVAILVPTTILAMQHFQTFSERLENFPVKVEYINRFRSAKEIKDIISQVKTGEIDILVGTHKIVNKEIEFRDLGLLIIDEEQKFGVKVKDQLKNLRVNVDVLTLTATPIPRTLHFSLMGARDL